MRHPPWRPEANPPFPCGLGLKSTVGTAVSVPPHCGDCSLSPTAWPRRSSGSAGQGRREEDEEKTRELLIQFFINPGCFK